MIEAPRLRSGDLRIGDWRIEGVGFNRQSSIINRKFEGIDDWRICQSTIVNIKSQGNSEEGN